MSKKIFFFIIAIIITFISFLPIKQLNNIDNNNSTHIMDCLIYDNVEIIQEFKPDKNYKGISFVIGTYMRVYNKGYIIAEIKDTNDKVVYYKKINMKEVTDSAPIYLKYNVRKNEDYTIKLITKDVPKSRGFIIYVTDDISKKMLYNNNEKEYGLNINYFNYKKSYLNIWYILFYIAILVLIYNFTTFGGKNEK